MTAEKDELPGLVNKLKGVPYNEWFYFEREFISGYDTFVFGIGDVAVRRLERTPDSHVYEAIIVPEESEDDEGSPVLYGGSLIQDMYENLEAQRHEKRDLQ